MCFPVPGLGAVLRRKAAARAWEAGATHAFAAARRTVGVEFSFGFPIDERVQNVVDLIPDECWYPRRLGARDGGRQNVILTDQW